MLFRPNRRASRRCAPNKSNAGIAEVEHRTLPLEALDWDDGGWTPSLDAEDGSERWRVALPGAGLPYLAVDGDDAAIVGQTDGSLAKVRSDGVVCALHGPIDHEIPYETEFEHGDVTVDGAGRVYLATPGTQSTLLIYELTP
jgi:hypothetical protein